ncbi:DoxX family protein [Pedobacter alluvionis]|uniref:DoxX family membrane protein n=1 Tax=Pedobacter alluvionis TaxID=475253 RepID=A0A497Y284_9SPHI|nr:DoxX family membrane protein [Pedobacter alluvionis]RLJ76882.1 putative membrane protein [Pedobacter alluvionis]TFB33858.1 DoxX family membrane protein [Pedobacter alluvionis]
MINRPIYKIFLWVYALFYVLAGCNHFLSTAVYYVIMPKWLPAHGFLIYFSGVLEIVFGILLLIKKTRKFAAVLIILMLIAFIPAHIYMIQKAPFMLGKILITPFIAWARLPFQLLLIGWAWYYHKKTT